MTRHNIARSEAFSPQAHVLVRLGRRRRRLNPVAGFFLGVAAMGVVASLIDSAIGAPVCLGLCLTGLLAWRFWPQR